MSGFSFADLQQVAKEAGFDLLPDGEYEAVIDKSSTKKTQNGKDMIVVDWKVASGPTKGRVRQNFVISPESPGALAYFFGDMKKLGLDNAFFASVPGGDAGMTTVAAALVGRAAKIVVSHREWNGSDRNEITGIKQSGGTNGSSPMIKPAGVPTIGGPAPTPVVVPVTVSATPVTSTNTSPAPSQPTSTTVTTSEAASEAVAPVAVPAAAPPDDPF